MPALMSAMVMPPPMVPAPMTPTRLIGRVGVDFRHAARCGAAARSAWKTWRSAADSGEDMSDDEQLALALHARLERAHA